MEETTTAITAVKEESRLRDWGPRLQRSRQAE